MTEHEYNTKQHDTTQIQYDKTRIKQDPTQVQGKLGQQKWGSTLHFCC